MKAFKTIGFLMFTLFCGCEQEQKLSILVKNTLDIERVNETVELSKEFLKKNNLENVGILDVRSKELMEIQIVDIDGDGLGDQILFQPYLHAHSEKAFEIVEITDNEKLKPKRLCYSRFVPERTDDYAWENDKVAFRAFGPNAQYRFENNLKQGTLSSGIDAWLKKVDYSIIDKWYKKYTEKTGTYHEDTGEGLDNFHVGRSRGIGGLAVKQDTIYYFSKNFINWKTVTSGPIRTHFYLEYDAFDANGKNIKISKEISLDKGQNLFKVKATIYGTDEISAGLTLHEKDGEVSANEGSWISYWQPHGDSELGTAILSGNDSFIGFDHYDSEEKDLSNAYAQLKVQNNQVTYYAGFAWKESGQFKNKLDWENYLNNFSKSIHNKLIVNYLKNNE